MAVATEAKCGPAVCLVVVSFAGCDRLSTMVMLVLAVGLQGAVFRFTFSLLSFVLFLLNKGKK